MNIIKSNKGYEKLCYNGYVYVLKHFGKSKITWRYTKRSTKTYKMALADLLSNF